MSHTEKCPVCNGKGTICLHQADTPAYVHPTCPTCHSCGGNGWIIVIDWEAQHE